MFDSLSKSASNYLHYVECVFAAEVYTFTFILRDAYATVEPWVRSPSWKMEWTAVAQHR